MPRKNNDNNPLQIKLRVDSLPKSVTPKRFYQRLMEFIRTGRELPPRWEVSVAWRNPGTKRRPGNTTYKWNSGDFETVVSDSREGFVSLLYGALSRRLRRMM
jgi:hypothetical protein